MGCELTLQNSLLILQLLLFVLGRVLDDISWHDIGLTNEVTIFQSISVASMIICVIIQIIRKWQVQGMVKILFFRSQLKFIISWSLIITNAVLFFQIFGCHHVAHQTQLVYFFMVYKECCINITQIFLTNFNFSLICNTKAHIWQFAIYQLILFAEIIYNGTLMIMYIKNLEGVQKDLSILFISLLIANQILIMDLIFRAAYEDRQREEEKENKLIHHIISAHHIVGAESPLVQNTNQLNGQLEPSKHQNKTSGHAGSQLQLMKDQNRVEQKGLPEADLPSKAHK